MKIIDRSLCIHGQVQHRLAIAQHRVHGHKHGDNVLDLSQFLCTNRVTVALKDLGDDCEQVQARNDIRFVLLLLLDDKK